MFPNSFLEKDIVEEQTEEVGVDFIFDYNTGQHLIKNGIPEKESVFLGVKQYIENVLRTPANVYKVYTKEENEVFGISVYNYIGQRTLPAGYLNSELKREVTENLLRHPLITEVKDWEGKREKRGLAISFTVVLSDDSIISISYIYGAARPIPDSKPKPSEPDASFDKTDISIGSLHFYGDIDDSICGKHDFDNEKQTVPYDLPIRSGLTHYIDFTKRINVAPIENGVSGGSLFVGNILREHKNEVIIDGKDYNYLVTDMPDSEQFSIYVIYKTAKPLNDWGSTIIGTGAGNSNANMLVLCTKDQCITVDGYNHNIISDINDTDFNTVCLTVKDGGYKLYINGIYKGEERCTAGTKLGFGRTYFMETPSKIRNSDISFKVFAMYNRGHEPNEVSRISNYLKSRFLGQTVRKL